MCLCWMNSNSGLLSFGCCSGINSLLLCSVCMYICSKGSSRWGLLTGFRSDIMSLILPYSCLLLSICSAYADLVSLFFMNRVCSWYLALRLWFLCPIYALWHVWRVILYIPLFSYSGMGYVFSVLCIAVSLWWLWMLCLYWCSWTNWWLFLFLGYDRWKWSRTSFLSYKGFGLCSAVPVGWVFGAVVVVCCCFLLLFVLSSVAPKP